MLILPFFQHEGVKGIIGIENNDFRNALSRCIFIDNTLNYCRLGISWYISNPKMRAIFIISRKTSRIFGRESGLNRRIHLLSAHFTFTQKQPIRIEGRETIQNL